MQKLSASTSLFFSLEWVETSDILFLKKLEALGKIENDSKAIGKGAMKISGKTAKNLRLQIKFTVGLFEN